MFSSVSKTSSMFYLTQRTSFHTGCASHWWHSCCDEVFAEAGMALWWLYDGVQLRAVPDQHRINTEHCDILDGFLRSLVKLLRRTWPVFLTWILARRASFCHWRGSKMVIMDDSESSSPLCTRVSGASKRQGTWRYCTWVAIEMSIFHLFSWRFEDHKAGSRPRRGNVCPEGAVGKITGKEAFGGSWSRKLSGESWWYLMIVDD